MNKELMDMVVALVKDGGDSAVKIVVLIQVFSFLKTAFVMSAVAWAATRVAGAIRDAAQAE